VGGSQQSFTPGNPETEQCDCLDNNCNGTPDEGLGSTTCGVGACQRTVQNCVGGLTQTCSPGEPVSEVCGDNVDNDCDGSIDEGFPDTDGDTMLDCVDPDDDNDLEADATDCAPLNATAFGMPYELAGLDVLSGPPTTIIYQTQAIGSGTVYEIIGGSLNRLAATQGFQEGFCITSLSTGGSWQDTRPNPRIGDGWYYIGRSVNACGACTFGSALRDAAGAGNVCQLGHVDGDGDGSPTPLDCNDTNPNLAPSLPEFCDGVDNNCDNVADEGNPGGGASCGTNVGECQAGLTVCSGGSLSCQGSVGPAAEICDGLDNDCDAVPDNHITADFDNDGQNDCVDTDDDNDLTPDATDCAPMDATAFSAPVDVANLDVLDGLPTPIVWTNQSIGSGTMYDVASGSIGAIGGLLGIDFPSGVCLPSAAGSPALDGRADPPLGTSWYYLVRSRNNCGAGSYGTPARDTHPACP
jgi:hypothetical protein